MEKEVCAICLHAISNPVCTSCYLRHASYWLRDFGLNEERVRETINKIRQSLPEESLNEHRCVVCGKDVVSICAYCAFLRTSQTILQLHANKKQIESFIDGSNFKYEEY